MSASSNLNEYATAEHALKYLALADRGPHRTEGEAVLLELVPRGAHLLRIDRPDTRAVALDFSPAMLEAARERFRGDKKIQVIEHNLDEPLPDLGSFDAIVSSFAIHHCTDERKQTLYSEICQALEPGGVFCNLEQLPFVLW